MKNLISRFVQETDGQDLIEYALLAALVAVACTAGMTLLQKGITAGFDKVIAKL
jgi:Flp pilus assembly pilin Flp